MISKIPSLLGGKKCSQQLLQVLFISIDMCNDNRIALSLLYYSHLNNKLKMLLEMLPGQKE